MTRSSGLVFLGLIWLAAVAQIPNVLLPVLRASTLTCLEGSFSKGEVKLKMTECLQPMLVTPTGMLGMSVTVTNVGLSKIHVQGFCDPRNPFELDIFNFTGHLIGVLGLRNCFYFSSSILEVGSSLTGQFTWMNTPSFLNVDNSSSGMHGLFSAQASLYATVSDNNTVIGYNQISGPVMPYEIVAQVTVNYDVPQIVVTVLLGVNIVISASLLREVRISRKLVEQFDLLMRTNERKSDKKRTTD